jgi:hypothetical protein
MVVCDKLLAMSKLQTVTRCTLSINTATLNLILMLRVSVDVDNHRAVSTKPRNQSKVLLFLTSIKYYKIQADTLLR